MDPDTCLAEFRQALLDWQQAVIDGDEDAQHDALVQAVSCATALDSWLSRGGFSPAAWSTERRLNFSDLERRDAPPS